MISLIRAGLDAIESKRGEIIPVNSFSSLLLISILGAYPIVLHSVTGFPSAGINFVILLLGTVPVENTYVDNCLVH